MSSPDPASTCSGGMRVFAKKCDAAYTSDTSTMARTAPDSRAIAVCMTPRIAVSSSNATTRPAAVDDQDQRGPAAGVERQRRLQRAHVERDHRQEHGQHERRAEHERLGELAREIARRQPVAEAHAIRDFQAPRDEQEADQEREHRDAARDAVEFEIEAERLREMPGGIREQCDARERQRDQTEEDREAAHGPRRQ